MLVCAIHETADKGKTLPKRAQVQPYRASAVRHPKLLHPLTNEHERYPTAAIVLQVVECTPDTVQERRKVQIVGDKRC